MKRLIQKICACSVIVVLSIVVVRPAAAAVFNIGGPSGQVIDPALGLFTVDLITAQVGTITDINVSIEFAPTGVNPEFIPPDQPWDDFIMSISKGATTVVLHGNPTATGPNPGVLFDVTFDDEAGSTLIDLINAAIVPPLPNAVGNYQPDGNPLSNFDGLELAGTWTLGFDEICCPGETILASWAISGTTIPLPPALILFLSAFAMLGIYEKKDRLKIHRRWLTARLPSDPG
jgi:hypothetical protein